MRPAKRLTAAVLAAGAVVLAGTPARAVVGGESARPMPNVARIVVRDSEHADVCTGSLIAARWVVTAAHCLFGVDGTPAAGARIRVYLGETAVGARGASTFTATAAYVVAKRPHATDVAVLRLDRPATATPMTVGRSLPGPGTPLRLAGWGATTTAVNAPNARSLRTGTTVLAAGDGACSAEQDSYFCVDAGTAAPCYGDSGGPLFTIGPGSPALLGADSRPDPSRTSQGPGGEAVCGTRELVANLVALRVLLTGLAAGTVRALTPVDLATGSEAMLVPLATLAQRRTRIESFLRPESGAALMAGPARSEPPRATRHDTGQPWLPWLAGGVVLACLAFLTARRLKARAGP